MLTSQTSRKKMNANQFKLPHLAENTFVRIFNSYIMHSPSESPGGAVESINW